ncbi:MAG TPA: chromosome segregation protein SMC [Fimbriimonadaceae bacterium]|nr:chromosome segregation protein SMC [Fimbriimonadaceae bacterium]HRJ32012.1 chromosome segregation protein SMC [Fimbriimonadaceae bacterium]
MRLKRVQIFGFKTFADKTTLDLDGDFTAVIGPNGCGKSNIVDAIMWGLGEPNARALRAQTSQDVIFSGSATRKPVGFAEVTLIFDNEDGTLGLDLPEVSVTRRLSRNGNSEYFINKRPCRQRDFFELFADSGLGRAGYAIVGQKEIDAALAASAEDRRAWIDEAAGVQRYRARRQEALRRLDQAEDHLERIHDIVQEIEHQREPLRREAETARRYKEVAKQLREVESGLMMVELVETLSEIGACEERMAQSTLLAEKERIEGARLQREAAELGTQIETAEQELEVIRGLLQGNLTALERAEGNIRLAEQKLASLDDFETNLGEESEASRQRVTQAQNDLQQAQTELANVTAQVEEAEKASGSASERVQELDGQLRAAEAALSRARQSETDRLKFEAEAAARAQRLRHIERELKGIEESSAPLREAIQEAEGRLQELQGQVGLVAQAKEERAALRQEALSNLEKHSAGMRGLLAEMASLEAKQRGIASTLELFEGLAQGSRAVMALVAAGRLKKEYKPVGQAFSVDTELALAIETALGGAVHDLITPHDGFAKEAIEILKRERLGRATFQPINLVRNQVRNSDLLQAARRPGVVGIAADLVKVAEPFRPVIESLLGRTLITETLDDALALAQTRGWSKAVSLDGEVVHASGAVTGGNSQRQTTGIVQRQAELNEVTERLESLARKRDSALARQEELEAQLEALDPQAVQETPEVLAAREELQEVQEWLQNLKQEQHTSTREEEKLRAEKANLRQEPESLNSESIDVDAVEKQRNQLLIEIGSLSGEAQQLLDQRRQLSAQLTQAKVRTEEAQRRVEEARHQEERRGLRAETLAEQRLEAGAALQQHQTERVHAAAQQAETQARLEEVQGQRSRLLESNFQLSEQLQKSKQSLHAAEDIAHRAELERAKLDAKRATHLERLLEEYGISQEEAIAQADRVELPEDATALVQRLRRETKSFGEVNLGAIEAFDRLTERYEELTAQQDDVLRGKAEVEAGIKELDGLTRDRFMSTFERLQLAFADTFQRMFGGGEASLSLSDPDDVLATGVQVEVTIPGKRRQRLELLSGGERAMSACAFLFAILRVKPSPLVVLDEVDAPLDGRNVERFIEMLKEAAQEIQFIVITHNPVTIEAAPTWFGVTMESGSGVTTVLPYRVPAQLIQEVIPEAQLQPL